MPVLRRIIILAGSVALASASATVGDAQNQPDVGTVKSVHYRQGNIDAQWIPYGRRWAIEGNTVAAQTNSDIVLGAVVESRQSIADRRLGRRPNMNAVFDTLSRWNCWRRNGNPQTDTSFRLVFTPTRLGSQYSVRLRFLKTLDASQISEGIYRAFSDAVDTAREQHHRFANDSVLQRRFQVRVKEVALAKFPKVMWVTTPVEGTCTFGDSPGNVVISPVQLQMLNDAVVAQALNDTATTQLDSMGAELSGMLADPLFDLLFNALARLEANSDLQKGDAEIFRTAVSLQQLPDVAALSRFNHVRESCFPQRTSAIPRPLCNYFTALLTKLGAKAREEDLFTARTKQVDSTLRQLSVAVEGAFLPIATAELQEVAWDDASATSDKLRIGMGFGYGAAQLGYQASAPLNINRNDFSSVGVLFLKFYPYAVDKTLPDPYLNRPSARWSLTLGSVIYGNLRYHGQDQEKFAGNLQPVAGLSYDLTRYLTLEAGGVFYRQPSVNPATSSTSRLRISPLIMIGFDFDGANRISTLLKGVIPGGA
jgi:hypothetical protein